MTRTLRDIQEAAGSRPCRLHSTWSARGNLSIHQYHYQDQENKDTSKTTSTSTQTEYQYEAIDQATQTEHINTNTPYNAYTRDDSSLVFDGIINTSLELLLDITDTTNDIARLTRDAEKLFVKMPVGTNFENSALKASFSLSSLPPSTGLEGPDHAKIQIERPYNSLTKKRKDPKHDSWRKSWGSNCDNKDDFWSALQANYDYIMDNQLIDSCHEIDRDITQVEETWTLNQFISHFSELCSFLNDIQDTVYGKAENVTNWALRTSHMEELSRVSPRRKAFNDQAGRLSAEHGDEVGWRVAHLNSKWEQLEHALSTTGCSRCEQDSCPDIEHEVRCLRKWVKEMESRLQPLNFQLEWTVAELEKKALEHMVLQREIENHSKIVSSVVRLCGGVGRRDARCHASNARRVAAGLERRYHLLFLRSLEWQCHIEALFKQNHYPWQDLSSDADSDEEPCMKQPRLSSDYVGYSTSTSTFNQREHEDVSSTHAAMDIDSEPVSVKMLNNGNEHEYERETNNKTTQHHNHCENGNDLNMKELKAQHIAQNSVQHLTSCGHSQTEKVAKEKNTLQKLPVFVEANIGSYYYKHRDTDSELDTNNSIISVVSNKDHDEKRDESSEDEFTYCAKSMDTETIAESNNEPPEPNKECIQRLVQRVEELVSSPKVDPLMFHTEQQKSKLSRVKEWLNFENEKDKRIDSCDASGECTSGEEEDKESQSSEDLNDSIVTCRPHQLHDSCLPLDDPQPEEFTEACKVSLRPKRFQMKGNRPWSVSCLSQISPTKTNSDTLPNFSISESALNNLSGFSPNTVKIRSFNTSANSVGVQGQGNNSTSSTVEEAGVIFSNEGTKPVSARKKKIRLRKKHMIRKNESGSESHNYRSPSHTTLSPLSPKCVYTLVKSGSFSGSGSGPRVIVQERHTASDPSSRACGGVCDTSTTSGADSEDDKKLQARLPNFLLGPHGMVKGYAPHKPEDRDSSPEKSSLNTTEEQSSSLSEQAWDNYQEKYLSENYSEAHDSDAARRLLEFGEDYRCYLDSQSDCWSAHSQNHSPQFRRKATIIPQADSDSEIEDIKQYINESKAQLKYTKDIYDKHVAMELNEFLVSSDCGEIIATCERHIYGLEVVIDANDDTKVLPDIEVMEVKALMSAWMDLKWSAKKMQSSRALYNEVLSFKKDLSQYAVPYSEVKSKEELMAEIDRLTEVQNVLQDKKRRLLELNVAIHRYSVNENSPCYANLKAEVSDLYTLWNDTCQSVGERMGCMQGHLALWAQLEARLDELHADLRSDGHTLRLLDTALRGGAVSTEVASSVRDVAKLLSEANPASNTALHQEGSWEVMGSLSDSGISDSGSGSEQELSERERRLAAIRRLVRQLDAVMAPDSEARTRMLQRLHDAEAELRALQHHCRGLIVRTAVAQTQTTTNNTCCGECGVADDGGGGGGDEDPTSGTWFRRVLRYSVPFQVALVALICIACLLEPSCCDSLNNLSLSLTPQLRYVRGPPPV